MDLSVIIVNWNTENLLKTCLSSLFKWTENIDYEVLVVDNHSADGSVEMVEKHFPQVRLVRNKENVGFARACNQAIKLSDGKYVLLLNSDTELFENTLERMFSILENHPEAAALGCQLIGPSGAIQMSAKHFPSLFRSFIGERIYADYLPSLFAMKGLVEVDTVCGACLMLRASDLSRIGLMDEKLFMYYEDGDLCYRLKKHGKKVLFATDLRVIHFEGKSLKSARQAIGYWLEGREYFFQKHYGKRSLWIMRTVLLSGSLMKVLILSLVRIFSRSRLIEQKLVHHWEILRWYFNGGKSKAAKEGT